ncbi:glycine/D-amino acid oxidase-like deaminating enzyme [Algoriphagus ratkowskyi]|uniref:FAD-dependent oxidoreductase n=1 Tax=Algoriphagus ratkowskyi TaxID=57028 RepID=A0A2W7RXD3_9BACT|nr:FAD-dependent oxidoreductase [Algoriphagus ratkowskyi]PZX59249.1 glycine/D-amino acid oxidase-like deaminating enzyme [Algoriphagus ratkowskyi]TXD77475.1 FAD-dependent oxidoreductase [Algoriphagus ratkowskyi]
MEIDFLLIGHGLAGTALAYRLKQAGKKIRIIDEAGANTSSRIAAGLFNPVTGRKMVKTWKADYLFPLIKPFYRELERVTGSQFLTEKAIYRPFLTFEEQNEWMGHSADPGFEAYLEQIYSTSQSEFLKDPYGGVMLRNSGWLNINNLLDAMTTYFKEELILEKFDEGLLSQKDELWEYRDLRAKAIIYCNGTGAMNSKFFNFLPFAPVKGEILELKQEFTPDYVVNRGVFRVHLGDKVHRVGSTYTKHDLDIGATDAAKIEILGRLTDLVRLPVEEIVSHKTGIRPATRDRKPFLGKHPTEVGVYLFNGFGAKGVSLIPYFSEQMVTYLINDKAIDTEVDIARYFNYI